LSVGITPQVIDSNGTGPVARWTARRQPDHLGRPEPVHAFLHRRDRPTVSKSANWWTPLPAGYPGGIHQQAPHSRSTHRAGALQLATSINRHQRRTRTPRSGRSSRSPSPGIPARGAGSVGWWARTALVPLDKPHLVGGGTWPTPTDVSKRLDAGGPDELGAAPDVPFNRMLAGPRALPVRPSASWYSNRGPTSCGTPLTKGLRTNLEVVAPDRRSVGDPTGRCWSTDVLTQDAGKLTTLNRPTWPNWPAG